MQRDHDIIIQGSPWPCLGRALETYLSVPWVRRVIVSHWDTDPPIEIEWSDRVIEVKSEFPENPGLGNRNLQIISTYRGLGRCLSPVVVKTRSDQVIGKESLLKMAAFYERSDGLPHVIGNYRDFPYHPQDHVFWGSIKDMHAFWAMRPDLKYPCDGNFNYDHRTRANSYIGANWFRHFDPIVQKHIDEPEKYLVDKAPLRHEAMAISNRLRDKVFHVFPKIDLYWDKFKHDYPYEWWIGASEYCAQGW